MEAIVERCERSLRELGILYDQYFAGTLRRPPVQEEEALAKAIERLRTGRLSASLRYRAEGLHQRFQSYRRMWSRVLREMEEGTYRRDVNRARRRLAGSEPREAAAPGERGEEGSRGPDEAGLRKLYRAWVDARTRCDPEAASPSFDKMAETIRRQVPELLQKHGAQRIDFQVVIRNGKAVLKAIPRS